MEKELTRTMTLTSDEWEFMKHAVDGYTYIAVDYLNYDETQMLSRMKDRIFAQMPDEVF